MAKRDPAAKNATGWHLCLDVLTDTLNGDDTPRVVGSDAVQHRWEALRDRYIAVLAA